MSVIKCQSLLHSPNFASVRHTTVALSRPNYPQLADRSSRDLSQDNCVARRNRVTPDVLQDTLSLICDRDSAVRLEYTNALAGYISHEMPNMVTVPIPMEQNGRKSWRMDLSCKQLKQVFFFILLRIVQAQVPTRGLVAGIPMFLALQRTFKSSDENPVLIQWIFALDELLARLWFSIATVRNVLEVV